VAIKILLAGHQSPIGLALLKSFEIQSLPVVLLHSLDAVDMPAQLASAQPSIVVNALTHSQLTSEERWQGSSLIADYCRLNQAALIHLSSHEVFGVSQYGLTGAESDEPEPDTPTGQEFLRTEQYALQVPRTLVVRVPWLLDGRGGLLERLCEELVFAEECVVCDNWRGTPVYTDELARLVLALVQQLLCGAENWGIFHLHSSDHCSEAELADHLRRLLQKEGYVVAPVLLATQEHRLIPSNGWLKGQRCNTNFGFQYRTWCQGVKRRVQHWLAEQIEQGRITPPVG
jgi:dTDP-4-dehydrorhamnose reductase